MVASGSGSWQRPCAFPSVAVRSMFPCMPWPKTVPDDLRRKLEAVLGYRNRPAPQDAWGAVLEWLEESDVEAPEAKTSRTGHDDSLTHLADRTLTGR